MKKLVLSFLLVIVSTFTFAQTTWSIDPMHSSFNFNINHMGISFIQGRYDKFEGNVVTSGEGLDNTKFNFTIDAASINTDVAPRDTHLKSADFFDVAKYPSLTFVSTASKKLKDNTYAVTGNLTIKGVTKPVTLNVIYGGTAKDKPGNTKIGIRTSFKINRLDYGINYDPTGAGVAKDVEITVFAELIKK